MKLLILFILALPLHAMAQNGPIDAERARIYFAEQYAHDFAEEYNALTASGEIKDIYGYFAPKEERAKLVKPLSKDLHLRAEGAKVIFEAKGKKTLTMEVLDVAQQKYLINGKPYVHDWNGDLGVQHQRILGMLGPPTHASLPSPLLFDFFLPKANAIIPILVAIAIDACVEGGCEAAAYFGARAALWLFTKTPAVEAAAVSGGIAARRVAVSATQSAARSVGKVVGNIWEDIYTDPAITNALRATGKALKTPANYVKAPFKALAFVSKKVFGPLSMNTAGAAIGGGISATVLLTVNASQPYLKYGIPPSQAAQCAYWGISVEKCGASQAAPKVEVTPTAPTLDGGTLVDTWCATANANETSYIVALSDKTNVVKVFRSSPSKSGEAISAIQYQVTPDHQVKLDTYREYEIKEGKQVSKITIPKFYLSSVSANDLVAKRSHSLGTDAKDEEADMKKQILKRDTILKQMTNKDETKTLIQGDDLKNYNIDPLKSEGDPQRKKLDAEVAMANDVMPSFKQITSTCNTQAHMTEVKTAASAARDVPPQTPNPAGTAK